MNNHVIVFVGPTISRTSAQNILDATYVSPAQQGDVYKAWLTYRPGVIALIDGHFENVPAPWHKEILWVMAQGTRIYGASSMGALRASELHQFGMIGVGDIFEAYKNGALEDDDEVAVIHGPAELGYPVLSEAMVNIRKTLDLALNHEIIDVDAHKECTRIAKSLFYRDRTYSNILERLDDASIEKALRNWLQDHRQDLKQSDAVRLLETIRDGRPHTCEVNYEFQDTQFWRAMKQQIDEGWQK